VRGARVPSHRVIARPGGLRASQTMPRASSSAMRSSWISPHGRALGLLDLVGQARAGGDARDSSEQFGELLCCSREDRRDLNNWCPGRVHAHRGGSRTGDPVARPCATACAIEAVAAAAAEVAAAATAAVRRRVAAHSTRAVQPIIRWPRGRRSCPRRPCRPACRQSRHSRLP